MACGVLEGPWQAGAVAVIAVAAALRGRGLESAVGQIGLAAAACLALTTHSGLGPRGWAGLAVLLAAGSLARLQEGRSGRLVALGLAVPLATLLGARPETHGVREPLFLALSAAAGWLAVLLRLPAGLTGWLVLGSWALAGPWGPMWCLGALMACRPDTRDEDHPGHLALAVMLAGPVAELTGFWTVGPDPGKPHLLVAMAAGVSQVWLGLGRRPVAGTLAALGLMLAVAGASGSTWAGGWLTGSLLARAARPNLGTDHPVTIAAQLVLAVSLPWLPALPAAMFVPLSVAAVALLAGLSLWHATTLEPGCVEESRPEHPDSSLPDAAEASAPTAHRPHPIHESHDPSR